MLSCRLARSGLSPEASCRAWRVFGTFLISWLWNCGVLIDFSFPRRLVKIFLRAEGFFWFQILHLVSRRSALHCAGDGCMTRPHKTIPREFGIVGARIEWVHLTSAPLRSTRRFLRS